MMFKVILIFLLAMVVVGMIGNALYPGALSRGKKQRKPLAGTVHCPKCGQYRIGKSGCANGCDSEGK